MAATRIFSANRISDGAGCVLSGGAAQAVTAQTTTTITAGTVLNGNTVTGTVSVSAPTVTAATALNTVALTATGTATLTGAGTTLVFDAANDMLHLPTGVTQTGVVITADASAALSAAELLTLRGVQIITTAHRTLTMPAAAALVAAFPQLVVGSCFTFGVANASAGAFNIIFAAGAGGTIPAAAPRTTVTPGNDGTVILRMTNIGAATEAYDLFIFGQA